MQAVQLIAHGSRRAEANADLVEIAGRLKSAGQFSIVVASYLEIAEPSIPSGAEMCIEQGASEVILMPYFLSAGSHVTRDLERFRNELSQAHSGVKFVLCQPLGLHPLMLDIIHDRITKAVNPDKLG